ncbi:MAG: RNA polymerase factor sigma-54 [Anaerolineales bacterium]
MHQIQSQGLHTTLATAHLTQTMSLLVMNVEELGEKIHALLAENPALELREPTHCPQCLRPLRGAARCPICSHPQSDGEPVVFLSSRWDAAEFQSTRSTGSTEDETTFEEYLPQTRDLPTYILQQLAPSLAPEDRPLAAHILTSLDEDGLLDIPALEIARYHHVPIQRVEAILHCIQRADPPGTGASSPRQALLIQLEVLAESRPVPPLAHRAIAEHLEHLGRYQMNELAASLGIPVEEARALTDFIRRNLNPYPARAAWGDWHNGAAETPATYRRPDAIIQHHDPHDPHSPLVVEILAPVRGQLHIDPRFRQALRDIDADQHPVWAESLEQARLILKCLGQRNQALVQLLRYLAREQQAFIVHGDLHLRPLTRAQVSLALGVHESTISRAVAGKTVQLPNRRIIPLERFFDSSLPIRTALRNIVNQEQRPLNDSQLAKQLAALGYPIARRTVAKYRQMEGILPAPLRHPPAPKA